MAYNGADTGNNAGAAVQFARPLNIGQRVPIDNSASMDKMQIPAVLATGDFGVMNGGDFVKKIVALLAMSKEDAAKLAEALSKTDATIAAQKDAADKAIKELNESVAGQHKTIGGKIAEIDAAIKALNDKSQQQQSEIKSLQESISGIGQRLDRMQQSLNDMQEQINAAQAPRQP